MLDKPQGETRLKRHANNTSVNFLRDVEVRNEPANNIFLSSPATTKKIPIGNAILKPTLNVDSSAAKLSYGSLCWQTVADPCNPQVLGVFTVAAHEITDGKSFCTFLLSNGTRRHMKVQETSICNARQRELMQNS